MSQELEAHKQTDCRQYKNGIAYFKWFYSFIKYFVLHPSEIVNFKNLKIGIFVYQY